MAGYVCSRLWQEREAAPQSENRSFNTNAIDEADDSKLDPKEREGGGVAKIRLSNGRGEERIGGSGEI